MGSKMGLMVGENKIFCDILFYFDKILKCFLWKILFIFVCVATVLSFEVH